MHYLCTTKSIITKMKLKFIIQYNTAWGESLHVNIEYRSNDGSVRRRNMIMNTADGRTWTLETAVLESKQHPVTEFSYAYSVEDADGNVLRREWDAVARTYRCDTTKNFIFPDQWREIPLQLHLYSNAYLTTVGGQRNEKTLPPDVPLFRRTVVFRVSAPQLKKGQSVALCGNHPAIGGWNTSRYVKMKYSGQTVWTVSVNVMGMTMPLEYKYVVTDDAGNAVVAWEEGDNRSTGDMTPEDGEVWVLDGGVMRLKEDTWKVAGMVIPVFSLRSDKSYGTGDFGDLRRMVDWAVATGMKAIQILPVNDTTKTRDWADSYPYNAISIYALHPHYMDLEEAGTLKSKAAMTAFHRRRRELNAMSYCDYVAVDKVKTEYIRKLYEEKGKTVTATQEYRAFVDNNAHWLMPYAAFCSLRDRYGTARFKDWKILSEYSERAVEEYCSENEDDITYNYFVQYILHRQLKAAGEYARSKGVIIKGDIPIGICRDSVEAWMQPQYFNLDAQTGAPPDAFSANGQNWGFPTYNWEAMMADGCSWWRHRFSQMDCYFDAFRIDHVLGFFRIWEIPEEAVFGLLGHFAPALPLTPAEIEYFGLQFRKDFFTKPFINDAIVDRLFGVHAQYVKENFLVMKAYNLYDLKECVDTQRKVKELFEERRDENSVWIRDGLYKLNANVLFIEDKRQHDMYHPRIGVYNEPVFEMLGNAEKDAFMRLYNNFFYQRHNMFWGTLAMKKLPMVLHDTRMMVCAEDLGMMPDCVSPVLDALRILTLEIQTMPKQTGFEFTHLGANPYRSVATFATHDMPPMRLWWEESPETAQRYYVTMMQKEGRAPEHLPPHLAEEIIARHLYSPSMLCLLALQDWLAMDGTLRNKNVKEERINVPSDSYNRWKYRMHITIEDLLKAEMFNRKLKTMISRSKR